jgi:hypothetical protein
MCSAKQRILFHKVLVDVSKICSGAVSPDFITSWTIGGNVH